MAAGMEAKNDLGSLGMFEPDALGSDGNAAVGSGFEEGPHAPNIRPPGAARGRPQNGAFLFPGQIPSSLRGEFKFAMGLLGVAMKAQGIHVGVGFGQVVDLLAGEIGRQPLLPELVFAFDFAFGLRGWGIKETNVVEAERCNPSSQGQSRTGTPILAEAPASLFRQRAHHRSPRSQLARRRLAHPSQCQRDPPRT